MLRSSSEEIAASSSRREVLRSSEKVTLDRIVRFIKVNAINVDVCLLETGQRMIGGEDQLGVIPQAKGEKPKPPSKDPSEARLPF